MMTRQTIHRKAFESTDALALCDEIKEALKLCGIAGDVVYHRVEGAGSEIAGLRIEQETLSDGSIAHNLILETQE